MCVINKATVPLSPEYCIIDNACSWTFIKLVFRHDVHAVFPRNGNTIIHVSSCPCLVTPVYTGQLRCSQGTQQCCCTEMWFFCLFFWQSRSGWRSLGAQQVWQREAHSCILIWSFTEHGEKRKAILFIAELNGPLRCYFVYNHRDLNVWALACGECVLTFTIKIKSSAFKRKYILN